MILGDNFFYGQNLTSKLLNCAKLKTGAKVLLHSSKTRVIWCSKIKLK